jgi:hypothetical protein
VTTPLPGLRSPSCAAPWSKGVPVTRESFAQEASFALGGSHEEALREVDAAAQRLGVSSLS